MKLILIITALLLGCFLFGYGLAEITSWISPKVPQFLLMLYGTHLLANEVTFFLEAQGWTKYLEERWGWKQLGISE